LGFFNYDKKVNEVVYFFDFFSESTSLTLRAVRTRIAPSVTSVEEMGKRSNAY